MPSSSMWLMQISESSSLMALPPSAGRIRTPFSSSIEIVPFASVNSFSADPKRCNSASTTSCGPAAVGMVGFTHDPQDKAQVLAMSVSISVWMQHSRNAMEELGWIDTCISARASQYVAVVMWQVRIR